LKILTFKIDLNMKIKIKLLDGQQIPAIIKKGDWIDLRAAADIDFKAPSLNEEFIKCKRNADKLECNNVLFQYALIPLGVCMELPKGYEAILVSRSSTPKKYGIMMPTGFGVIDNSYNGDSDEWMMPAISLKPTSINFGDRICQFRIQLSQKATMWQKIKWLFTSNIKFKVVETLGNTDRQGIGEGTGHND
jgi:dUTP pyrophosphatase